MIILLILFYLAIGSLLNVIIFRLPIMLNLFLPRSFCPHCKQQIAWWHNIPLLSFVILRGKCKHCGQKISWQYPLVELSYLLLALLATWQFGITIKLIFALVFIGCAIVIFCIDLKHQIIPDALSLGLLWVGMLANTQQLFTTLPLAVYGAIAGYLSLWLVMQVYYLITKKVGMGHGDFKLLAALGAWFGIQTIPYIILIASILGTIIGLLYLIITRKNKDTHIPFGPFLCTAGLTLLFYSL